MLETATAAVTVRRYCMAPDVFACTTRHGTIFLDLEKNRYIGVSCDDAWTLEQHVDGFPVGAEWGPQAEIESRDATALESLLQAGILIAAPTPKRRLVSTDVILNGPLISIGEELIVETTVTPRHIGIFAYWLARSAASIRLTTLRKVVYDVYRRRQAALERGYTFDVNRTAKLVHIFRAVRPYFLAAQDHCLLHALTLVNFLAHYEEFPVWVFGVGTDPWTAHSWVQHDHYLIDSTPDKICHLDCILGI